MTPNMVFLHTLFLTFLLIQTTAQPLNSSLVYPDVPAPPILTKHQLSQELASWQTIQIFTALLNAHPFLIPPNGSLILAPTNMAFIKLLGRLAPHSENPFSAAASITNTLDKLINSGNLTRILAYHIIPRDLTETQLTDVYPTVSGGVLSFTNFPSILDIDPVTRPRRVYRQIKAVDGSFMFISDVLLPLPLEAIVPGINNNITQDDMIDDGSGDDPKTDEDDFPDKSEGGFPGPFSSMPQNATLPNGTLPSAFANETVDGPPLPPGKERQDLFSVILGALAPAMLANPFASNGLLISSRTDLQIMNALIRVIPGLNRMITSGPSHILAPTDTAFIDLFLTVGGKLGIEDVSLPDISDAGFVGNLTEIMKLVSAVEKVWNSVSGLPGLAQVVAYHVIPSAVDYPSLLEMSRSTAVPTALENFSLVFERDSIIDGDGSRNDAMRIASFPTLTGYVTVVDGVLTPFDTSVVGAIVNGPMRSATPSPTGVREEGEAACFPGDGRVYTKHGVRKLGDLIGGDEIRVDDAVERHSAVFMFTHKMMDGIHEFVRIWTGAGHNITLTSGHYIHSKGSLIAAGRIRIGDSVRTISGESAVTKVEVVKGRGLIAPHTVDGGLIVDGVLVSGYSTAVHPWVAHALLAPVRWYVKVSGAVEPFGGMFYRGGRGLDKFLVGGADVITMAPTFFF